MAADKLLTSHCTVVLQQQCDNATLIRFIYTYIHVSTKLFLHVLYVFKVFMIIGDLPKVSVEI